MNSRLLYNKSVFISIFITSVVFFSFSIFHIILFDDSIAIPFLDWSINLGPPFYSYVKSLYFILLVISTFFVSYTLSKYLPKTNLDCATATTGDNGIFLNVGVNLDTSTHVIIPERGLFQNILITGTIGTGKTSSAMYPFLDQLLKKDVGMLILDVKGNFYSKVLELNKFYKRKVFVIELGGKYTYNPLHKPNIKPSILANRLRTILTLFSNQNTSDTYWLDKVELFLTECIKLCRLYNNGYVTFTEVHKLVNTPNYLNDKLEILKKSFIENKFSATEIYDLKTSLDFFQSEFKNLDSRVLSIIQSEITRITQLFISDFDVSNTFCPPENKVSFSRIRKFRQ